MIGNAEKIVRWLFTQDRDKLFEIVEHREKRSNTANKYAWALIVQIANAMRKSKHETYLDMLRDYGQSELVSVNASADVKGILKYYDILGESSLNGKDFIHYRVYKGSSEYDTREMSILIDGIVQEAKNLGIETLTPAELARLKDDWKG